MRSSSHCESYCAPPLCCFPCLPKTKDESGSDPKSRSPCPAIVTEDKPPVVQKIEECAAPAATTGVIDGVSDDDKCYREVVVAPKSYLKRATCEDSSKIAPKSEDKLPMVQKIKECVAPAVATDTIDGIDVYDKCYREVTVAPKSCLKKANCEDSSKIVAKSEDKPPMVQKIKECAAPAVATDTIDGVDNEDKCYSREVAVAPKSCLKKANCEDNDKVAAKGNVKWRDLLGKDLTQVKEFESGYPPCFCHVSCTTISSTI